MRVYFPCSLVTAISMDAAHCPSSLLFQRARQCKAAVDLVDALLGDAPGGGWFSRSIWGRVSHLPGRSVGLAAAPGLTPWGIHSFSAPKHGTVYLWRRNRDSYYNPRKGLSTPSLDSAPPGLQGQVLYGCLKANFARAGAAGRVGCCHCGLVIQKTSK